MKKIDKGPVYGVSLIDTLPIGSGSMMQALPSREDLKDCCSRGLDRVSAGYEVVLSHYYRNRDEVERLKAIIRRVIQGDDWSPTGLQEAIGDL